MEDMQELELVAELFEGLSNRSKLAILLGVAEQQSLKEIADDLDITRQGLEKNIDKMVSAGLLAYDPDGPHSYRLTPIGRYVVRLINEEWETLVAAKRVERQKEKESRERAEAGQQALQNEESDGFTFQIDNDVWERTIQTQKWKLAEEELREILDLPAAPNDESE